MLYSLVNRQSQASYDAYGLAEHYSGRDSDGPWTVLAREQRWQSFSSDSTYNREPQVNVRYARYNVAGFDIGAEADATRFTISSSDMTQGNRFVFNPYVSYPIERPG